MRTVLIVDDQARIRDRYKRILTKDGYITYEAADADEANELLKKQGVDLILLDIKMPDVSGKVLYEIKKMFHQDTKVIVASVYPLDDQKQIIAGADDYFDKSEGLSALRQKVARHLENDSALKTVVLIDDDQKVRVHYANLLGRCGYEVKGFGDNAAALQFLTSGEAQIDLLILDLAMPKIDGCHFFEIVRIKYPQTKILIASNYDLDTQKFMAFDADDYFDKTQGNALFLSKVKRLIRQPKTKEGCHD